MQRDADICTVRCVAQVSGMTWCGEELVCCSVVLSARGNHTVVTTRAASAFKDFISVLRGALSKLLSAHFDQFSDYAQLYENNRGIHSFFYKLCQK